MIQRFVDYNAEFVFVPADKVLEVVEREGAIPFDVKGAELGHHDEFCSFDAIIAKYGITDPALLEMAMIVRGADTNATQPVPEAAGLKAIAEGFRLVSSDDADNMIRQFATYDALYAYCREKTAEKR